MIFLGSLIFISVVALISIKWISALDGIWKSVWLVTGTLSLFRIACLWIGYFSMKTGGLGQVFGYFMVLPVLPEALLVIQSAATCACRSSSQPRHNACRGRWPRRKAVEVRKGS
jgi:hypothetical protein